MKKEIAKEDFYTIKRDLLIIKKIEDEFALRNNPILLQTSDFSTLQIVKNQTAYYRSEILWILRNFDFEDQQDFSRVSISDPNWENYLFTHRGWKLIRENY